MPVQEAKPQSASSQVCDVLLCESREVQENIRGNSDAIIKIALYVMPLVSGAYLLALGDEKAIDQDLLSSAVCLVASLILLAVNGLWVHNMILIQYKYKHLMPALYRITDYTGQSLGSFISERGTALFLKSLWLAQLVILVLIAVFLWEILHASVGLPLQIAVVVAVVVATISTIVTAVYSFRVVSGFR